MRAQLPTDQLGLSWQQTARAPHTWTRVGSQLRLLDQTRLAQCRTTTERMLLREKRNQQKEKACDDMAVMLIAFKTHAINIISDVFKRHSGVTSDRLAVKEGFYAYLGNWVSKSPCNALTAL
jgi:hypothetical protein